MLGRPMRWQIIAVGGGLLVPLLFGLVMLPALVYPPLRAAELRAVGGQDRRIELQNARYALQSGLRGQLLQGIAGLVVVAGAAAAWRQIRVAREGQITERFSRAVDHLGSDKIDIRVGGVHALERIARNSPADRPSVTDILWAFVRNHAGWPVGTPDGPRHPTLEVDARLPWLQARAADIQAAVTVLGRTPRPPDAPRVYLSYVDLRAAHLAGARLPDCHIRHSNLARAWMLGAVLERSDLFDSDLRETVLRRARMAGACLRRSYLDGADLREADLSGADLRGARLRRADLRDADLRAADLTDADLTGADLRDAVLDGALLDGAQPAGGTADGAIGRGPAAGADAAGGTGATAVPGAPGDAGDRDAGAPEAGGGPAAGA